MRKSIYPSQAAFMWGETVLTQYSSGCLRAILISAHGVRESFPAVYADVGAAHEAWYEGQQGSNPNILSYEREVPVKRDIPGVPGVTYSGRIDVLEQYAFGPVIVETKGTISKDTRLSVIRKGIVKLNQLAQIVSYMIATEIPRGRLVVGYYEYDLEQVTFRHCEGREFKIEIDDHGMILVDRIASGYSVMDALAHRQAAAAVLADNAVGNRPDKWDQAFGGPCRMCVFKDACTKYDAENLSTEAFVDAARYAVLTAPSRPEPIAHVYKPKKPSASRPKRPNKARASTES